MREIIRTRKANFSIVVLALSVFSIRDDNTDCFEPSRRVLSTTNFQLSLNKFRVFACVPVCSHTDETRGDAARRGATRCRAIHDLYCLSTGPSFDSNASSV